MFKDVDSIPLIVDFREFVKTSILGSRVTLVVIGRGWLNVPDEQGNLRLDNPADFVRIEIETALATPNMAVIPVLVGRATMPAANALPPSLQQLAYLNAAQVRPYPDFNDDLHELIHGIDPRMRLSWVRRWRQWPTATKRVVAGIAMLSALLKIIDWDLACYAHVSA